MKQKIIAGALFVVALLLIGAGYLIAYRPDLLGICSLPYSYENSHCLDLDTLQGFVFPMVEIKFLLPLFLLLFFIRADVFKLWWKFALGFALWSFYVLYGTSPLGSGGIMSYSRTEYTAFLSLWFLLASLLLIGVKTFRPTWPAYAIVPFAFLASVATILMYHISGMYSWVVIFMDTHF